jgi:hypothetical protein
MSHTVHPLSRRAFLYGGVRLAVVVAGLVGVARIPDVHADTKKKPKIKSVAERTDEQRSTCEGLGGKLAVLDGPDGGNTTECKGGSRNGYTCINTKKASTCSFALTTVPTKPGGGGAAPPSGGTEDPTDPASPFTEPAVPPTGGNEQPSDGGNEPPSGGGGQPGGRRGRSRGQQRTAE